ncbi:MAG: peptide chain release factor 1 [Betaproteobacteria bacterium]|nr:MAG: peptide chain release factor 1 [Betaproteobacteria bacterium]
MKDSFRIKLEQLERRLVEVESLLADPSVVNDMNRYRALSKERSDLEPVAALFKQFKAREEDLATAQEMLADPDMKEMAQEEIASAKEAIDAIDKELTVALLPKDPSDERNIFLEIRAGTGGDESAIFAGDLLRMYTRYAERQRFQVEIVSSNESELGGYREVIARIIGQGAYSKLKFESGTHRVQRVPETEAQGRIHTSACTVAILPEADPVKDITINPSDLRIDTFRASGAGGQHINKTDSAVRIVHIPTGVTVECQDGRSQHSNKARAMEVLASRLLEREREAAHAKEAGLRKSLVGSGDRSERIRTYNYPQGRMTDHRINLTLYKLDMIMDGDIGDMVDALRSEHQAEQMASMETA